jgi:hypothetical protein
MLVQSISSAQNINFLSVMFRYVTRAVLIIFAPLAHAQLAISNVQASQRSGSVFISFISDSARTFLPQT